MTRPRSTWRCGLPGCGRLAADVFERGGRFVLERRPGSEHRGCDLRPLRVVLAPGSVEWVECPAHDDAEHWVLTDELIAAHGKRTFIPLGKKDVGDVDIADVVLEVERDNP